MKELGEVVPGADSALKPVSSNPVASGTAVPPPTSLVCSYRTCDSNQLFSNSAFDQPNQILVRQIYYMLSMGKPTIGYSSETNVQPTSNPYYISTVCYTRLSYLLGVV